MLNFSNIFAVACVCVLLVICGRVQCEADLRSDDELVQHYTNVYKIKEEMQRIQSGVEIVKKK